MARALAWMLVLGMPSLLLGQTHSELSAWRTLYRQTSEGGPADSAIVPMTAALQAHPNNAVCMAFHATAQLQKAQELWNPLDKLTTFQTWRCCAWACRRTPRVFWTTTKPWTPTPGLCERP